MTHWITPDGAIYEGDCRLGDRAASGAEVAAWDEARTTRDRPPDISDRQFARGLWGEGVISFDECEAFVSMGAIPAALQVIIDQLPDDDTGAPTPRKEAIIFVRGAKIYTRDHALVETVRIAHGWSAVQLDTRWRAWGAL